MAGPNYDVLERVFEELVKIGSVTTTYSAVNSQTAEVLKNNIGGLKSPFCFSLLSPKTKLLVVMRVMSACFDWQYRMFKCVCKLFNKIDCMDGSDQDWHWAYVLNNFRDSPRLYSPASWSWSGRSEYSYVWSPVSPSENGGESSSGSDDVDLLAEYKARGGV
jgi:hypothetical protein